MDKVKQITKLVLEQVIKEVSMNRVLAHVNKTSDIESWGIITAFRGNFNKSDNLKRNKMLATDIRNLGLGFIKLEGHWQECQISDIPYEKCPNEDLIDAIEVSFFVPEIKYDDLVKLTKKYNQDASVYSGNEVKDEIYLLFKDGTKQKIATKATPGKISQAFSKLKGKPFMFEYNL